MPCFFFISGWLLKDEYITELKTGIYRRIQSSYYPFVLWTIVFVLFHNFLTLLHLYDVSYSKEVLIERIIRALTMTGSEPLLGGFWLFISLFWASIASLFFLHFLNEHSRLTKSCIIAVVFVILLLTVYWHCIPYSVPEMFKEKTMLATAFYLSGYLCRKFIFDTLPNLKSGGVCIIVPAIAAIFDSLSMDVSGWQVIEYYIIAIAGCLSVVSISKALSHSCVATLFTYIGAKTKYVLVFHFISFKLVSYLIILIYNQPIENLVQFPVLNESERWMWIVYSFCGIALPLIIWELSHLRKISCSL